MKILIGPKRLGVSVDHPILGGGGSGQISALTIISPWKRCKAESALYRENSEIQVNIGMRLLIIIFESKCC